MKSVLRSRHRKRAFTHAPESPRLLSGDEGAKPSGFRCGVSLCTASREASDRSRRSFTLIELLMTIVIVGIVAVPFSVFLFEHVQGVFQSRDLTLALNLARSEMERVNNLAYAAIVNATCLSCEGYAYDVNRAVTYQNSTYTPPESLKKITIDVKKTGTATSLLNLTTFIANKTILGQ